MAKGKKNMPVMLNIIAEIANSLFNFNFTSCVLCMKYVKKHKLDIVENGVEIIREIR